MTVNQNPQNRLLLSHFRAIIAYTNSQSGSSRTVFEMFKNVEVCVVCDEHDLGQVITMENRTNESFSTEISSGNPSRSSDSISTQIVHYCASELRVSLLTNIIHSVVCQRAYHPYLLDKIGMVKGYFHDCHN